MHSRFRTFAAPAPLSALLALSVLAVAGGIAAPAVAQERTTRFVVTTEPVEVASGPAGSYYAFASAPEGTVLQAIEDRGVWTGVYTDGAVFENRFGLMRLRKGRGSELQSTRRTATDALGRTYEIAVVQSDLPVFAPNQSQNDGAEGSWKMIITLQRNDEVRVLGGMSETAGENKNFVWYRIALPRVAKGYIPADALTDASDAQIERFRARRRGAAPASTPTPAPDVADTTPTTTDLPDLTPAAAGTGTPAAVTPVGSGTTAAPPRAERPSLIPPPATARPDLADRAMAAANRAGTDSTRLADDAIDALLGDDGVLARPSDSVAPPAIEMGSARPIGGDASSSGSTGSPGTGLFPSKDGDADLEPIRINTPRMPAPIDVEPIVADDPGPDASGPAPQAPTSVPVVPLIDPETLQPETAGGAPAAATDPAAADTPETDGSTAAANLNPEARFAALEAAFESLRRSPLTSAETRPLQRLYAELARDAASDVATAQAAETRAAQLQIWSDLQAENRALQALRDDIAAMRTRTVAVAEGIQRERGFTAVGRLTVSRIFDGSSLPRFLRLEDLDSGRTVAYLDIEDRATVASLIGQVVGVQGRRTYDPGLQLDLIRQPTLSRLAIEAP